jgi:hypothetical protein
MADFIRQRLLYNKINGTNSSQYCSILVSELLLAVSLYVSYLELHQYIKHYFYSACLLKVTACNISYKWVFSREANFVIFFQIGGIFFSGI